MAERRLGIIMNGVTGRMGMNQHLKNAVLAIREAGGVALSNGERVMPDPLLVGRDADKLRTLAAECAVERWTTDLDAALADPKDEVYFDGVTTLLRPANLQKAVAAGKHIYTEKPIATALNDALAIYRAAAAAGVKHGAVQDKLYAPGLRKLRLLVDSGFFGRVLTVRIEGCYWVFEGNLQPPQRPSWNYRKEDGGGMILDMMPHYWYMLADLFGAPTSLVCHGVTQIPERWDERGKPYQATADDGFFAIAQLEGGAVAQIISSWCVRVRTDDIIVMQIDGTGGSAVAGLRDCWIQPHAATPKAQWSLDVAEPVDFYKDWQRVPDTSPYVNAFRIQWERFIRHVCEDAPYAGDLGDGARGVQFAELALQSSAERRWLDIPPIEG
jgi:predicted dehydrogenase